VRPFAPGNIRVRAPGRHAGRLRRARRRGRDAPAPALRSASPSTATRRGPAISPAGRFWAFQFIEGGWLLALSVLLIAATVWLVHRRTA